MAAKSLLPRLDHMIEAIERIRAVTDEIDLATFEGDWRPRMIVERGLEIVSEASRHLPDDLKSRHPGIPWPRIAAIGNRLRHEYDDVLPDILWKVAREDLLALAQACKAELEREQRRVVARRQAGPTQAREEDG